jgi:hypothetical protein
VALLLLKDLGFLETLLLSANKRLPLLALFLG